MRILLLSLIALSLLASGCGTTTGVIKQNDVDSALQGFAKGKGVTVSQIKCPKIKAEKGTVERCTAEFDGFEQTVRIKVGERNGDNYNLRIAVIKIFTANAMNGVLQDIGVPDTDCKSDLNMEKGKTMRCSIVDPEGKDGEFTLKVGADNVISSIYLHKVQAGGSSATFDASGDVTAKQGPKGDEYAENFAEGAAAIKQSLAGFNSVD